MAYQEIFSVGSSFTWNISSPSRVESTTDGRYIAWLEEVGSGHLIKVYDILNNQYYSEIKPGATVRITDINISPDDGFIYFAAPEERAISGVEGEPILIESGQIENFFIDKLTGISFSDRSA